MTEIHDEDGDLAPEEALAEPDRQASVIPWQPRWRWHTRVERRYTLPQVKEEGNRLTDPKEGDTSDHH